MRARSIRSMLCLVALAGAFLAVCCRDFAAPGPFDSPVGAGAGLSGQPDDARGGEGGTSSDCAVQPVGGNGPTIGGSGVGGTGEGADAGTDGALGGSGGAGGQGGVLQAGSDAGPRSPATLAGLSLWLESEPSSFVTADSRVSKWRDSSGLGNDAIGYAPRRPLLRPSGLNGRPTLLFDGKPSNLVVYDAPSVQLGSTFTVAFVAEWTNDAKPVVEQSGALSYVGYGAIMTKTETVPPFMGLGLFANFPGPFSTEPAQRRLGVQLELSSAQLASGSNNLNDGEFRLFVVQRPAAGLTNIRVNGTAQGQIEMPPEVDTTAAGHDLSFGGENWRDFRGELAEFLIVNGPITDVELHGLEAHLMEKFDL